MLKTGENDDLSKIKPGDKVLHRTTYYRAVLQVTRTTPTMIFCGDYKFRKKDGQQIPKDTYGYSEIEFLTPELAEQMAEDQTRGEYVDSIRMASLSKLPLDVLKGFVEQIKAYNANVEGNNKMV